MVTVETAYAFWTDSVGLISISADNLFCCTALAAGLFAARGSFSRIPSPRFSYGLTRLESLCGFVNGLLLLVVAILIFLEAIDRTFNPEYIDMSHIFAVCFCGIVGNGLGLIFFPPESRRENHNVLGIYLHILANTLAYVGITTSTVILGINPSWTAAELIVALFVAMIVVAVALPLLFRSGRILMNIPASDLVGEVQSVWNKLHHLEGVTSVGNFRVWHLNPTRMMACVHLGVSSNYQLREGDILRLVRDVFQSIGISSSQVTIHISIEDITGDSDEKPQGPSEIHESGESSEFHG
jgi:solute carrier family 30 (zinc transporter), member 5/7